MGYRSEIGILITLPEKVSGEEIIKKFADAWGEDFENYFEVDDQESIKGLVYIHSTKDLKWYEDSEGYEDVTRVMALVRHWEEDYSSGGISFLRIGEDMTDIEEIFYGEPERYLCCDRSISW